MLLITCVCKIYVTLVKGMNVDVLEEKRSSFSILYPLLLPLSIPKSMSLAVLETLVLFLVISY